MNGTHKDMNVYRSCVEVESLCVVVNTTLDTVDKLLAPCCTLVMDKTATKITNNPEESFNNYIKFRENIIEENKRVYYTNDKERKYTSKCVNCPSYVVGDWSNKSDQISFMALNITHAPCQSKCIYCYNLQYKYTLTDDVKDAYEKIFKFLNYLKAHDKMKPDIVCQPSSGEISIHPYKDKILEFVDGMTTKFLSNCFVFDQGIADNLQKNHLSTINLSIDSGTNSTWKRVKGFDNFAVVISNLRKYTKFCDQEKHQQVTLKYIVLPGVNTRKEDYIGVVRLMKKLNVNSLIISRNLCFNFDSSSKEYDELFKSIIALATTCKVNELSYELFSGGFTSTEKEFINKQVEYNLKN